MKESDSVLVLYFSRLQQVRGPASDPFLSPRGAPMVNLVPSPEIDVEAPNSSCAVAPLSSWPTRTRVFSVERQPAK